MAKQGFTTDVIHAAIVGFEQQKKQIEARIAELKVMLSGISSEPDTSSEPPRPLGRPRKGMSAAGRARVAAAQALIKAQGAAAPESKGLTKPKRRISPEGMKRIIAGTKKRWALKRAAAAKE